MPTNKYRNHTIVKQFGKYYIFLSKLLVLSVRIQLHVFTLKSGSTNIYQAVMYCSLDFDRFVNSAITHQNIRAMAFVQLTQTFLSNNATTSIRLLFLLAVQYTSSREGQHIFDFNKKRKNVLQK